MRLLLPETGLLLSRSPASRLLIGKSDAAIQYIYRQSSDHIDFNSALDFVSYQSPAGPGQSSVKSSDKAFEDWLSDDVNSYQRSFSSPSLMMRCMIVVSHQHTAFPLDPQWRRLQWKPGEPLRRLWQHSDSREERR